MPGLRQPPPEALGIFTGLTISYPEYSVVTPQTGYNFSVRCLNVSEVSRLKTSATTPAKVSDLINRTLWDAIVSRPVHISDYDTFLKATTLRDREALIYGLYVTTFGDSREFSVSCDECGTTRTLKVNMSDMFSITPYPGSDAMKNTYKMDMATGVIDEPDPYMEDQILQDKIKNASGDEAADAGIGLGGPPKSAAPPKKKVQPKTDPRMTTPIGDESNIVRVGNNKGADFGGILALEIPVELPVAKVVCVIHQPALLDEFELLNNVPFLQRKQSDLINETLIIKRFEVYNPNDSKPKLVISDREDILRAYQSLPNPDKKVIYDKFREVFSEYGISLKTNWDCLNCGAENSMELEIVAQFFRMVAIS